MLRFLGACVLAVGGLVLMAGCGGGDGDASVDRVTVTQTVAASTREAPTTTTRATTAAAPKPAPAPANDAVLLQDMANGLDRISTIALGVSDCGTDPACIVDTGRQLSDVADEELVGLEARVQSARKPCVRDAGEWYVNALKRFQLAYDYLSSGDIAGSNEQLAKASSNMTEAGDTAKACLS